MTKPSSAATKGGSGKRPAGKPAAPGPSRASFEPRPSGLAQRRAAAVLEVLAGVRTPPEAAVLLSISVNAYYLLERRALAGLTAACEPKPKGRRVPSGERRLALLEREVQRLRRECLRQSALVRATQRAVGLPAAAPAKTAKAAGRQATGGTKRKRRRPATVRALRAAEALRKTALASQTAEEVEPGLPENTAAESSSANREVKAEPSGFESSIPVG